MSLAYCVCHPLPLLRSTFSWLGSPFIDLLGMMLSFRSSEWDYSLNRRWGSLGWNRLIWSYPWVRTLVVLLRNISRLNILVVILSSTTCTCSRSDNSSQGSPTWGRLNGIPEYPRHWACECTNTCHGSCELELVHFITSQINLQMYIPLKNQKFHLFESKIYLK